MILWKSIKDRRREVRLEGRVKARILVVNANTREAVTSLHEANIINMSSKGLCLALTSPSLEGFHLTRCLQSPDEYLIGVDILFPNSGPWRVMAEVKWIDRRMDEDDFCFRLGAAVFDEFPAGWQRMLKD